ncbi:unnamed protein product [Urochloa decumbens]|uniref:Protein kinase domain-containing protein n=1 Tax=Urochloa decumbens TaxID=240449 RepID=A0ABC8W4A2_9POAL
MMPLLLLQLLLLAVFPRGAVPVVVDETYYNPGACPNSFRCGDGGVDVQYPFFPAASGNASYAIDGHTSYFACGYPGMAIACDGGRATLKLKDNNYTVLAIDYDKHAVTVADAEVLDGGAAGECPRVTHNVTVPAETWLNLSTAANDNLAFFLDCVFTAAIPPPPAHIREINCSSFQQGDGRSFVAMQSDMSPREEWLRACKKVVVAPVLKDLLLGSDEYLPRLNCDGYGKVLKQGFQLTWDPSAGACFLCEGSGGQCSCNQRGEFIGCLCSDGRLRNPDCGLRKSEKKNKTYIAVSAVAGSILLTVLLSICAIQRKKFHVAMSWECGSKRTSTIESFLQKHEAQYPKRYTYSEVKRMTKSFACKLGKGGFGTVYKGNLPNGRDIAVKLLKESKDKDDGQEFMNEIASIMRTSHINVVTLLGFCIEGSKRALIYEYMPNGSLERFAFGRSPQGESSLSWERLFDITVGVARGLEYLHRGCNTRIVHFDIKPHNILLDRDFCPKISDFGLAKRCMTKESVISIDGARGTIGYIAPEVFSQQFGQISSKSDVYSYGMMILEMVGARKNINRTSDTSSKYFPQWIYEHLEGHSVDVWETSVHSEVVRKLLIVGLWCIQLQPNNRPSMTRVVEMLESRANDLQIPPRSLLC